MSTPRLRLTAYQKNMLQHIEQLYENGSIEVDQEDQDEDDIEVSKKREMLLHQLDLSIELRRQMESSCQKLIQETGQLSSKRAARELLLTPVMKQAQLRLSAVTEAVRGDYVLDNYDYFIYCGDFATTTPSHNHNKATASVDAASLHNVPPSSSNNNGEDEKNKIHDNNVPTLPNNQLQQQKEHEGEDLGQPQEQQAEPMETEPESRGDQENPSTTTLMKET